MPTLNIYDIPLTLSVSIYTWVHLPSSSISTGSGRAGLVSGLGSISPGRSLRGSSSTSPSFCCTLSL